MNMNINRLNGMNQLNYRAMNELKSATGDTSEIAKDAVENTKVTDSNPAPETEVFERSNEQDLSNLTYKPFKKNLSAEEVKAIKEEHESAQMHLIQLFIRDMQRFQEMLVSQAKSIAKSDAIQKSAEHAVEDPNAAALKASQDLLKNVFGSLDQAYPPMATTPEGAQEAIADGGSYSVGAVSDRIMKMATSLAGDDPEKLKQMRAAVEEGFERAGAYVKGATNQDMPQISRDTYDEVMKRFDNLMNKTSEA